LTVRNAAGAGQAYDGLVAIDREASMTCSQWHDRLVLLAGLWLFASPFALGTASLAHPATVAAYVAAVVLVSSAAEAPPVPDAVEEWIVIAVALALAASPWLLGYDAERALAVNALVVGGVVAACALVALVRGRGAAPPAQPEKAALH
jgi:predicted MFS family arabinose efflux permease